MSGKNNKSKSALTRQPSWKHKKPPEIRQTLTSKLRLLKANPLLKDPEYLGGLSSANSFTITDKPKVIKKDLTNNLKPSTVVSHEFKKPEPPKTGHKSRGAVPKAINKKCNDKKESVTKPNRRSLSAQYFKKQMGQVVDQPNPVNKIRKSLSVEEIKTIYVNDTSLSPVPVENNTHTPNLIRFRSPSAYQRRSVLSSTPKTESKVNRRSTSVTRTPHPNELQVRLNNWLKAHGKTLSNFHHLKCFGIHHPQNRNKSVFDEPLIEEENKENVEVFCRGSYDDLGIEVENSENNKTVGVDLLTEDNLDVVAKEALVDLHKLILEVSFQKILI